jgi:hypothetical protein
MQVRIGPPDPSEHGYNRSLFLYPSLVGGTSTQRSSRTLRRMLSPITFSRWPAAKVGKFAFVALPVLRL